MTDLEKHREDFCGTKLRIARAFQGFTQTELAQKVGVKHQFIAALENNQKGPSRVLVHALADALGFEANFFFRPALVEFGDAECSFRSLRTTPVTARTKARAFATLLGQFLLYADEKLTLPQENLPVITSSDAPAREEVERIAQRCRMQWGLGLDLPITNMTRVMESLAGVPVARFEGIAEKIDAFSRLGKPSMIVVNEKVPSRLRFDLAHECGHLVLHRGRITGTLETEAEANQFAGALLLPRSAFTREFPRGRGGGLLEALFGLKKRWRTSVSAMIRRAFELKLIDGIQYRRLYKNLSFRGWLRREPEEFERETPETVPLVLAGLQQYHCISQAAIALDLGWKPETLSVITGVTPESPERTLAKRGNVFSLSERRRTE